MPLDFLFFLNSILFGLGLAMDAFSVSLANGLSEPRMRSGKMLLVAGVFAIFQMTMPLIGWACIHTVLTWFTWLQGVIPWVSLVLLSFIGGKMLYDVHKAEEETCKVGVGIGGLILQGIATSIDALSVGFTIADYTFSPALLFTGIIGIVTFFVCLFGVYIGKHFGTRFSHKAEILGGFLLILIGIEIFLTGIF